MPPFYVRFNCYFRQCYFSFQFLLTLNGITASPVFFLCKVQLFLLQCYFSFQFLLSPSDITASPSFLCKVQLLLSPVLFRVPNLTAPLMTLLRHPFFNVRFNCYCLQCYLSFQILLPPNDITASPLFM